jgi:hypothetical protein
LTPEGKAEGGKIDGGCLWTIFPRGIGDFVGHQTKWLYYIYSLKLILPGPLTRHNNPGVSPWLL